MSAENSYALLPTSMDPRELRPTTEQKRVGRWSIYCLCVLAVVVAGRQASRKLLRPTYTALNLIEPLAHIDTQGCPKRYARPRASSPPLLRVSL